MKFIFVAFFFIGISCYGQSSTKELASKFLKEQYNSEDFTLNYRLFVPEELDPKIKLPLILTFHSAMTFGTDNEKHITRFRTAVAWTEPESQKNNPCFVLSHQYPDADSRGLADDALNKLIDLLTDRYPIDKSRIYITGTSSGAFSALKFMTSHPSKFAASILMSGGVSSFWTKESAKSIKQVPMWVFHGNQDDIVSVEKSRKVVGDLESIGVSFTCPECKLGDCSNKMGDNEIEAIVNKGVTHLFTELPTKNHFYWNQFYDSDVLKAWLFKRKNK